MILSSISFAARGRPGTQSDPRFRLVRDHRATRATEHANPLRIPSQHSRPRRVNLSGLCLAISAHQMNGPVAQSNGFLNGGPGVGIPPGLPFLSILSTGQPSPSLRRQGSNPETAKGILPALREAHDTEHIGSRITLSVPQVAGTTIEWLAGGL